MTGPAPARSADEWFAQAQAAKDELRFARAERALRRAVAALERDGPTDRGLTAERALVTLAYVLAERGHVADGEAVLDEVEHRLAGWPRSRRGPVQGLLAGQRGLLRLRAGDLPAALAWYDQAVPRLRDSPRELARALLSRGAARLYAGMLGPARDDFEAALRLARERVDGVTELKARHNLAYLDLLGGNLVGALAGMDAVEEGMLAHDPSLVTVLLLDRARARYAAGLLVEADEDLRAASSRFAAQRNRQDEAECELARAQVALSDGRDRDALALAGRARTRFERRGSTGWALLAQLTRVRAALALLLARQGPSRSGGAASARAADRLAAAADELGQRLREVGMPEDARMAQLVAIRARIAAGRPVARPGPARASDRIVTKLYARRARAEFAAATGDSAGQVRELRAGLRQLHRYQASFGSLDLQTAVARHGRALAVQGLTAALRSGSSAAAFEWSERARAMASRLPPVRPPQDPQAAALLAELRFLRSQELAGPPAGPGVMGGGAARARRARQARLEQLIRRRSWYAPGTGDVEEPVRLAELRAELDITAGSAAVAHVVAQARVHALVVTSGRDHLVPLGPLPDVLDLARRLRADLDVLALRAVPAPIRRSARASLTRGLAAVHALLWAPIAHVVPDGPVVLVPSGALFALPWTLLPGLAGRPVAVARSATAWLRAARAGTPLWAGSGGDDVRVVLAAGPDLARAQDEVKQIAGLWPGAAQYAADDARGDTVLAAADGADVVHLAAHGVHEASNPLFAGLRLADGPVFGYDVARWRAPPRLVVLSACDLGRGTERPGDEIVGMTAAMLQHGVQIVVAAVAQVGDEAACEVTWRLHDQLSRGVSPASALAAIDLDMAPAPFVAFGRGW